MDYFVKQRMKHIAVLKSRFSSDKAHLITPRLLLLGEEHRRLCEVSP